MRNYYCEQAVKWMFRLRANVIIYTSLGYMTIICSNNNSLIRRADPDKH